MADRYENLRARITETLHDLEWRAGDHLLSVVAAALSDADDAQPPERHLDECATSSAACGTAMQASAEATMTLAAELDSFLAITASLEAEGQMLTLGRQVREMVHAAARAGGNVDAAAPDIAAVAAEIPLTPLRPLAQAGWTNLDDPSDRALRRSRDIVNQIFNHDLQLAISDQGVTVSFRPFGVPFGGKASAAVTYHLVMVKDRRKDTFTHADAISVLVGTTNHCQISAQKQGAVNGRNEENGEGRIVAALTCQTDADGERLQPGESYAVFVVAVSTDADKSPADIARGLLSAPSLAFRWKNPSPLATPEQDSPALSAFLAGQTHRYEVWQPSPEAGRTRFFASIYLAIRNLEIALAASQFADAGCRKLLAGIDIYVQQLIHAADALDKLVAVVTRKKAANPLVSDNLVAALGTAAASAEKAVQLALEALRAAADAQTAITLAGAITAFQYDWLVRRYQRLTGRTHAG